MFFKKTDKTPVHMRYWLQIYKMQENLLLVGPKKGSCNCQDGPIFREFFFFLGGGGGGRGGGGGDQSCPLSFINLVLTHKGGRGGGLQFLPLKKGTLIWEDVRYVRKMRLNWCTRLRNSAFYFCQHANSQTKDLKQDWKQRAHRGRAALCKSIRKWQWPANLSPHRVCEYGH